MVEIKFNTTTELKITYFKKLDLTLFASFKYIFEISCSGLASTIGFPSSPHFHHLPYTNQHHK